MIAVISGDIIRSEATDPNTWMPLLKRFLKKQGTAPKDWEIFRGDAFQLRTDPAEALQQAMLLKSILKQQPDLDVRMSIGIGEISYTAARITESNGSAFVRSGRTFDSLKDAKQTLAFATGNAAVDETLNLMARFSGLIMDNWSASAAAIVQLALEYPDWNQQQVADHLKINQSAVSQSRKRAQLDLLLDFNYYYKNTINLLTG